MIEKCKPSDAPAIAAIYNHYVTNTVITFEEQPVSDSGMEQRITDTLAGFPWLVWREDNEVLGYAYGSAWKSRCAYRYSAESTVYLHPDHVGKGIGAKLYGKLLADLQSQGLHSIIAGIALPNPASTGLHEKLGFVKVAHFKEVGYKFDQWIDVGYWELVF